MKGLMKSSIEQQSTGITENSTKKKEIRKC